MTHRNPRRKHRLVLLALCLLAGCIREYPEVGPLQAGACNPNDSNPDRSVSFRADLLPLFARPVGQAGCSCHMEGSSRQSGITQGGLNLTNYTKTMRGGVNSADNIVLPGDPCGSVLLQSVSEAPVFGSRMPVDGPPFFSPAERTLLSDWIAEGAHDD